MSPKIRLYSPLEYVFMGLATGFMTYLLSQSFAAVGVTLMLFGIFILIIEIIQCLV